MDMNNGFQIFDDKHSNLSRARLENKDFVNEWFLMDSPLSLTIILASYLIFVLKLGPDFMRKRQPYQLKTLITLYNAVQVFVSCFLLYCGLSLTVAHGLLPKTCVIETEYRRAITTMMHHYLLAKISELLDTIFFVLRKKGKQLSFLHIYHHTLMTFVTWMALKYEPTYTLVFLGIANSFVHAVMYTYYGLSSYPSLAKYLWWKKYITSMQLIQFVVVLTHFGIATAMSDCSPSYIMSTAMFFNGMLFMYMFGKFYIDTYKKNNSKAINKRIEELKMDNDTNNIVNGKDKKIQNGNGCNGSENTNGSKRFSIQLNETFKTTRRNKEIGINQYTTMFS